MHVDLGTVYFRITYIDPERVLGPRVHERVLNVSLGWIERCLFPLHGPENNAVIGQKMLEGLQAVSVEIRVDTAIVKHVENPGCVGPVDVTAEAVIGGQEPRVVFHYQVPVVRVRPQLSLPSWKAGRPGFRPAGEAFWQGCHLPALVDNTHSFVQGPA